MTDKTLDELNEINRARSLAPLTVGQLRRMLDKEDETALVWLVCQRVCGLYPGPGKFVYTDETKALRYGDVGFYDNAKDYGYAGPALVVFARKE